MGSHKLRNCLGNKSIATASSSFWGRVVMAPFTWRKTTCFNAKSVSSCHVAAASVMLHKCSST